MLLAQTGGPGYWPELLAQVVSLCRSHMLMAEARAVERIQGPGKNSSGLF